MNIQALLFDMDGLLFDSERVYYRFWRQAGLDCGYDIPEETLLQLRSCDSQVARERLEKSLGIPGSYDPVRARRKELMQGYMLSHMPPLKSGVKEFLAQSAKVPGLRRLVVTQSATMLQLEEKRMLLEKSGILQYFDDIVTAADVKRGKPYPDIYLCACARIHLAPEVCMAFEDSPNGIEAASSAGVHAVMIPDMSQPDEALAARCFGVFPTLAKAFPAIAPYLMREAPLPDPDTNRAAADE